MSGIRSKVVHITDESFKEEVDYNEDDGDLWMKIRKATKDCAINGNAEESTEVQKIWSLLGDQDQAADFEKMDQDE